MSSTNKTANYQLSQFVGTDIPSILNDYNGDMRKIDTAIKEVANAGGDNATAVAELQATVGQHTTEIGGINSTVNALSGRILGVESKIPANASESNKLITAEDIPEIPSIAELEEEVSDIGADVKAIQLCVPANASEDNKLVTDSDLDAKQDVLSAGDGIEINNNTISAKGVAKPLHVITHQLTDTYQQLLEKGLRYIAENFTIAEQNALKFSFFNMTFTANGGTTSFEGHDIVGKWTSVDVSSTHYVTILTVSPYLKQIDKAEFDSAGNLTFSTENLTGYAGTDFYIYC